MPSSSIDVQIAKSAFLEGVRDRLKDDVEPYFEKLGQLNAQGKYPGNWATVRMIMPIIEAVAVTTEIDPPLRPEGDRPYLLLEKLGVPHPAVVWDMYRNGLSHTEQPFGIMYKRKWIVWSMTASNADPSAHDHSVSGQVIHINIKTLYEDFKDYVDRELVGCATQDPTVKIKTGKNYPDNYAGPLKQDLEDLIC
jgi:hypothetical protein